VFGRKGFTLIELLVVIAIISLLMGILLPTLSRVKRQVKAVVCRAKLDQWGKIWYLWLGDNEQFFGDDIDWVENFEKYYIDREMLFCPMATKTQAEGGPHPFQAWTRSNNSPNLLLPGSDDIPTGSYGLNLWVTENEGGGRDLPHANNGNDLWKTPNVKGAVEIPLFLDCSKFENISPYHWDIPPQYDGQPQKHEDDEMRRCCINRHDGFVNVLYMDFHADKAGLKQLWELKWKKNWYTDQDGNIDMEPPTWPEWMRGFKDYSQAD